MHHMLIMTFARLSIVSISSILNFMVRYRVTEAR